LLYISIALFLYFALGTFYNIKSKNLSGKEAIPNIEFWRSFPELVQEGMTYSMNSAKQGVNWVKGKVGGGNNSAYNEL